MTKTMDAAQARTLLCIEEPIAVAHTSASGKQLDDEGEPVDPRQTVPWVWALGPFGSWPETLETAERSFVEHTDKTWTYGESFRLGWVVVWAQGWGYAAIAPFTAAAEVPSA